MSLESQIADLVSAANSLTSTVAGKMSEIDQKVNEAVETIPNEIISVMGATYYVDQDNGSDSASGASESDPLKSFSEVGGRTPAGASVQIRLLSDYVFAEGERAVFDSADVFIRSFPDSGQFKIFFTAQLREISGGVRHDCGNIYVLRNCNLNFYYVDIVFPSELDSQAFYGAQSAIIGSHSGAEIGNPLTIRFRNVDFDIPDPSNNQFCITPGYGLVILSTQNVTAPAAWVDRGMMLRQYPSTDMIIKAGLIHDDDALIADNT